MRNTFFGPLAACLGVALFVPAASAQMVARASDVASPDAIVAATYEAIAREPGGTFDWDRFRSLFLPQAQLIPSTEQTGGPLVVMTVDDFVDWIDGGTLIDATSDEGFSEDGIHNLTERYGDVAHVFSTYEKHLYGQTENLGRGINTFQMIWNGGRWWITSIAWDEEIGAGPIPAKYLPRG
ncbi:MAG: hypothetical protein OEU54_07910 [Gemmatimonadota bacterium]|nr:hypothetical protein [Gemmatimonadota bacterium]